MRHLDRRVVLCERAALDLSSRGAAAAAVDVRPLHAAMSDENRRGSDMREDSGKLGVLVPISATSAAV